MASRSSLWAARTRGKRNPKFRKIPKICQFGDDFRPGKSVLLSRKSELLRNPLKSEAVPRQMHLSPSSKGVGWANGYCGIVITTHTQRLASF